MLPIEGWEAMWPKPLTAITSKDVESLVHNRASETRHLEFKRQPPNSSEADLTRFLLAVTAFANAGGGYIVYGINAETDDSGQGGTASEIVPIEEDIDALILRLESSMLQRIQPRVYAELSRIQVRGVLVHPEEERIGNVKGSGSWKESGGWSGSGDVSGLGGGSNEPVSEVLLVRIPASSQTPHAVQTRDGFKFPIRVSAGRQLMDMHEVRRGIANSESSVDRTTKFIRDRYEVQRPTFADGTTVLHLIPLNPEVGTDFVAANSADELKKFLPLWHNGYRSRYNLSGYLNASYRSDDEDGSSYSSTQIFRDGKIEAVTHDWGLNDILHYEKLVQELMHWIPKYVANLDAKMNPYPLVISLSLNLNPDTVLSTSLRRPKKVHQNDLFIPNTVLQEEPEDWSKALRPIFDLLWNAFGLDRCWYFDDQGNFDLRNDPRHSS
ncbi:MAG: ATP-binding protein [Ignavibacteria bacterium]|nr:ATP-binding protein [Ignavibacteria bacterium]